jgi:cytochrome P450
VSAGRSADPVRHVNAAKAFEPTGHYDQLRAECPLHHATDHEPPFYLLSRFDDVVETLRRPDLWSNSHGPGVFYQDSGVLGTTDDPDHARHRRLLRASFVPTTIEGLAPAIGAITDELLDAFVPLGEGEFVDAVAIPLPALAIAELLGVPAEHRDGFRHWSELAVDALSSSNLDAYAEAKSAIEGHIEVGVRERDAMLGGEGAVDETVIGESIPDDVLSVLTVGWRNGVVSRDEMRYLGYQLLVAGHETTTSLLGMMLYRLIERPELMARLRADRALLPQAIEEALRFDSPVHGLFRTNTEPVEVHGTTIPTATKLQISFASANRDPAQFPDPDEFRIDRDRREVGKHVAFGWGIHFCIGAPLARLETRIAFERILDRMADIELAGEPERNDSFVLHGLTKLPIRWTPIGPGRHTA